LARLLPPESASLEEVARHIGVQVETLERWREESAANGSDRASWTAAARLDAVLLTATMDEAAKSAWCRSNGVHLHDLAAWRQSAIEALGDAKPAPTLASKPQSHNKEDRRRIQELERELRRKNAALAETAALLVLSKEMAAIFRKGEDE
jgi:transposase-like protein